MTIEKKKSSELCTLVIGGRVRVVGSDVMTGNTIKSELSMINKVPKTEFTDKELKELEEFQELVNKVVINLSNKGVILNDVKILQDNA